MTGKAESHHASHQFHLKIIYLNKIKLKPLSLLNKMVANGRLKNVIFLNIHYSTG